jgi:peptidyl-prolyl cis-trans isomerase SurA
VRQYSDDPESRANGGDIGWVPAPSLDPAIQAVLDTLQVGQVSAPVPDKAGVHVFQLLGREAARDFAFDEIREELTDFVRNQKMEQRYQDWLDELKAKHYIERRAWDAS